MKKYILLSHLQEVMFYIDNAKSRYVRRLIPMIEAAERNRVYGYELKLYEKVKVVLEKMKKAYFIPEMLLKGIDERQAFLNKVLAQKKNENENAEEDMRHVKNKIIFFLKCHAVLTVFFVFITVITAMHN